MGNKKVIDKKGIPGTRALSWCSSGAVIKGISDAITLNNCYEVVHSYKTSLKGEGEGKVFTLERGTK